MRLATVRRESRTSAVRVDGEIATIISGVDDVGQLLMDPEWPRRAEEARGADYRTSELDFAPLIPRPDKIVCVGLNYRPHILEMGRELPQWPALFAKFSGALIGAGDAINLPMASTQVDWEAELAVIIGTSVRDANPEQAASAIAGYSVINDVSVRDWQNRTSQWLQGKTFEGTAPLGPVLATSDEVGTAGRRITCEVDGQLMQDASTAELVFDPITLVAYISAVITLLPGDVIATGTPGGVGHARKPPQYLQDGSTVVTAIEGIGECRNVCRRRAPAHVGT